MNLITETNLCLTCPPPDLGLTAFDDGDRPPPTLVELGDETA